MTALRSLLFNMCFFCWAMLASLAFAPLFILSPHMAQKAGRPWAMGALFLARVVCGIRHEIRGREHMPQGPALYACKHQSAWDTIIFLTLLPRPAYVLKRELLRIPLWGWYLWRMRMIAIDRSAKASSMKHMLRQAKEALADGRDIVIFPEGTRRAVGAPPVYHPGVAALASQLPVPVVPVALNSGCYWGKNAFTKHAGTIVMEFLPPLPDSLPHRQVLSVLQDQIETASLRLQDEALRPS